MDIRQFALPDRHGHLDLFLTADFTGIVSVWSFLQRKRLATIKTCFDIGGIRLAVDGTGRYLTAANYKTGKIECVSVQGELLWERKCKQPQFLSWIPALSSWGIGVEAGDCLLIAQMGEERSLLKGVERSFQLGSELFMGVTSKTLSIFDASLSVRNNLNKESFAVMDCDFFSDRVATVFAGAGVVLCDLRKKSCVKCPQLSGLPQACVLASGEMVYVLNERSGKRREVIAHAIGDSSWCMLIDFPWSAGRGVFAESGKYFLSHHAGVWDVERGGCVWSFEDVG